MKKLFVLIFLFNIIACQKDYKERQKLNVSLKGIITNVPKNTKIKIFLKTGNNISVIDSASFSDSTFNFKFKNAGLNFYGLSFSNNNYIIFILVNTNENITIKADFKDLQNYKITNSPHSEMIMQFENNLNLVNQQLKEINNNVSQKDSIISDYRQKSLQIVSQIDTSPAVILLFSEKFFDGQTILPIDKYYNLYKNVSNKLQKKYANYDYFSDFNHFIKNYEIQKRRKEKIESINRPTELVDFEAKTIDKKAFSLKSLQGKWILLNFWATWSVACGNNNNDLKYFAQKNPQTKIVQIALDSDNKRVLDSLKKYDFDHFQIIENKMWNSNIVQKYAVNIVPTYILINPAGKIVVFTNDFKNVLISNSEN